MEKIRQKLKTACQDHQAGESTVKCLSQEHNKMARVDFELRPCRSQSRHSQTLDNAADIVNQELLRPLEKSHNDSSEDHELQVESRFLLLNIYSISVNE